MKTLRTDLAVGLPACPAKGLTVAGFIVRGATLPLVAGPMNLTLLGGLERFSDMR